MAGMLPGVEAARRRRFHQSSNLMNNHGSDSAFSRRPSICSLYAPTHDTTAIHPPSSKYSSMRDVNNISVHQSQSQDENRLGAAAREAKRRLDERLQQLNHRRPEIKSSASERSRNQQQVQKTKNKKENSNNVLKWLKLRNGRKSSSSASDEDEEECVVCLEQMVEAPGKRVTQLPCGHRFHARCLVPWLETNAHCPCCRLEINAPS